MRSLLVLGSTGSIGTQALEVVRSSPGAFRVDGLCAGSAWRELAAQAREFAPRAVAMADEEAGARLREELGRAGLAARVRVLAGPAAAEQIALETDYDLAVHGMVGAAGLGPSVRVLERGRDLALANKESLVAAGELLIELSHSRGGTILPVDSELCAIHQCLRSGAPGVPPREGVRRVVLTASGGPFRDLDPSEAARATPEMALKHPNWAMGPRITVGSATLMNKALEVIEVRQLFGLAAEQIQVVVHRQSIVHSLVEFRDGSVLAQMGPPDMRGPLHYCLHHPERAPSDLAGFDTALFARLTFEEVDPKRFPALELGYRCLELGGDSGCVLNAADEVAVQSFLDGAVAFGDIVPLVRRTLEQWAGGALAKHALPGGPPLERVLALDAAVRRHTRSLASGGVKGGSAETPLRKAAEPC